jgi:hypothetical protein
LRFLAATLLLSLATPSTAAQNKTGGLTPDETAQGFKSLFDGKTLAGWRGATKGYVAEDGMLVCLKGGHLFTEREYGDFIFRFEFKLPPGGNNGVAIRSPLGCNPAYCGMEIQILDDSAEKYKDLLKPYQFHGSIYGVVPAKKGHLKPVGQWNSQEIRCQGPHVKVTVNGHVIVDANLDEVGDKTMDGHAHPGLKREKGHIGFLGHGARVEFRNIRIKELGAGS